MLDAISLLQLLITLATGAIGAALYSSFFFQKERRLFKNIKRPIGVVATESKSMTHEVELLRKVGFFNIGNPSSDPRCMDLMKDVRLVIIGYTANQHFRDCYTEATRLGIPVVIYARQGEIEKDDWSHIEKYTNYSICNTPLRLISDVFAIMSTYPEDLK